MSDQTAAPYRPKFHYGYSTHRPGYTICGKRSDEVTVTYYPECVTCEVCRDELGLISTADTYPGGEGR